MTASDTRNTSTLLDWSTDEKSETMRDSSLTFSGYLLTTNCTHETIKTRLEPKLTSYLLSGLMPWTGYNITLRRLYNSVDFWRKVRHTELGRATTVTIKTEPSNPPAPKDIRVLANEEGKVVLQIVGPVFWNGSPFKYHIRWEPEDQGRNLSGYKEVNVSSPWPSEKKWTTANLTLEPGVRYNVYVSAQNYIGPDVNFKGPELEKQVATAPLAPIDLVAESLTPTEAAVSWRGDGPAEYFQVTVDEEYIYEGFYRVPPRTNSPLHFSARVPWDEKTESSEHSLIVNNLLPARNYVVEVLACTLNECSGIQRAVVFTQPTSTPKPDITTVDSNLNSFVVGWTFPRYNWRSGYDGFLVRYCRMSKLCEERYTDHHLMNVSSLRPDTIYNIEVRVSIKHSDGHVEVGPAAKAHVKTWSKRPGKPQLHIHAQGASPNSVHLSWAFDNSSVSHVQFLLLYPDLQGSALWTNCTSNASCSVSVIDQQKPFFKTGFLTLKHLEPFTKYSISVRGCNNAGCGERTTQEARTSVSAPSAPVDLKVSRYERNSVFVAWDKPRKPAGPIDGYSVEWQCPPGERLSTFISGDLHSTTVEDLPLGGFNCTFWVSGFNRSWRDHLLQGDLAEAVLS
uniref:Putative receptor mediating netrin-dependent axon guidance n=1 Tax=Ixodes ricinus TaxID=34613 RepID=A0A0K8RHD6_IXORI